MAGNILQLTVVVELKKGIKSARIKEYTLPRSALKGIQKHLHKLLNYRILRACQSLWNTPLLPILKPGTKDCQLVQDLRVVKQTLVTCTLSNLYTLLGLIAAQVMSFTCLVLKNAFFCIYLVHHSQPMFALQLETLLNG